MSEIRATTISDAAGTGPITLTGQSAAKAWVNFNGTGTVAVRQSNNVSSITDNGTGNYAVNFTNAQVDANFAVSGNCKEDTANVRGDHTLTMWRTANATSSTRVSVVNFAGTVVDNLEVYVVINR